ncbi:MAG: elongation factor P hydroxylase [Acidobacteria bacterium]|nr:elongation factor P hydroxylase [Acidobacteriota bacterium]
MAASEIDNRLNWNRDTTPLISVFDGLFERRYRTVLRAGGDEPFYRAATQLSDRHVIFFRADTFSSALHEVAHWCIAGARRRQIDDYGYWYQPDGRTTKQQRVFEAVEVKPQALEWLFADACGHPFVLSADNLSGSIGCSPEFELAVRTQVARYRADGMPARAKLFAKELVALGPV